MLAYCFVIIFVGLCSSGGSVCRVQLMTWVTVIRLFLLRMMTCSFQNKTENLVQIATRVNLIGVISFFYAMSILRHWCTFCTNWFQCCIFYLDQLIYSLVFSQSSGLCMIDITRLLPTDLTSLQQGDAHWFLDVHKLARCNRIFFWNDYSENPETVASEKDINNNLAAMC